VADGSRSIIRLHCDITDVIAAARRRPREACRSEVALCSGRKLRAHRLDPRDPAGHRAPDRLGVILLEEMQARAANLKNQLATVEPQFTGIHRVPDATTTMPSSATAAMPAVPRNTLTPYIAVLYSVVGARPSLQHRPRKCPGNSLTSRCNREAVCLGSAERPAGSAM